MDELFKNNRRVISISFTILLAAVILWLMYYAQTIIIPIIIAIVIVYIINAIAAYIANVKFGSYQVPKRVSLLLTIVLITIGILLLARMFANTVFSVSQDLPVIEQNLNGLLSQIPDSLISLINSSLGLTVTREISSIFSVMESSIYTQVSNFAAQIAYFTTQTFVVIVYVIFIAIEQGTFRQKMHFIYPNRERHDEIEGILASINQQVQAYVSVKTYVSFILGAASFVVMLVFGLDNAIFWSILIFLLNYIPYVGSIVAVAFPVLFSLAQFGSWPVFLGLLGALFVVQMIVGYFLEPMFLGDSLGISPFVVLVSLTIFNAIWGLTGMLLAVPLVIIIIIALSHFDTTRPISILLSNDGQVYGVHLQTDNDPPLSIESLHAAD